MTPFIKTLCKLTPRHDPGRTFESFVRLGACALSNRTREPEYLAEAKRWTVDELTLFSHALGALVIDCEARPFEDILGPAYMEFVGLFSRQVTGSFYTPPHLCQLIGAMTFAGSNPPPGPITVAEPACGAGGMILGLDASIPRNRIRDLRVTATDINPVACDMTFINTSLWGVPTLVRQGNTLTQKTLHEWPNIHWTMPYEVLRSYTRTPARPL